MLKIQYVGDVPTVHPILGLVTPGEKNEDGSARIIDVTDEDLHRALVLDSANWKATSEQSSAPFAKKPSEKAQPPKAPSAAEKEG